MYAYAQRYKHALQRSLNSIISTVLHLNRYAQVLHYIHFHRVFEGFLQDFFGVSLRLIQGFFRVTFGLFKIFLGFFQGLFRVFVKSITSYKKKNIAALWQRVHRDVTRSTKLRSIIPKMMTAIGSHWHLSCCSDTKNVFQEHSKKDCHPNLMVSFLSQVAITPSPCLKADLSPFCK